LRTRGNFLSISVAEGTNFTVIFIAETGVSRSAEDISLFVVHLVRQLWLLVTHGYHDALGASYPCSFRIFCWLSYSNGWILPALVRTFSSSLHSKTQVSVDVYALVFILVKNLDHGARVVYDDSVTFVWKLLAVFSG